MATPIAGAPTLTMADAADEPGVKRARLNEAGGAQTQVRLRARATLCSPGWPQPAPNTAALAACLALALACLPAQGEASAPKAPSGAGAPLPNTSASADHYRFPQMREPTSLTKPVTTCVVPWHGERTSFAHLTTSLITTSAPQMVAIAPVASHPPPEEEEENKTAQADDYIKPKPLDRPCVLEFKQARGPEGYAKIDLPKANFEFYSNNYEGGFKPTNPMCISSPATGPLEYGVTEQFARDYVFAFPQGIDVPTSDSPGCPTIHLDVSWRFSSTPNPSKRRIDKDVLARISLHVQHFEIRSLAQFISPQAVALGWEAHGYEAVNPRWGTNKIKNESGEETRAGHNSVIWVTIIPGENHGLFGA